MSKNLPTTINGAQRLFVRELIETGDALTAAKAAKIKPADMADMARSPLIIKEIRQEIFAKLHLDILPRIIKGIDDMATGIKESDESNTNKRYVITKHKLDLCKLVLDRTGIVAPKAGDAQKPLTEMSLDELHALVARLEEERSAAAKPVDAQELPAPPSQALDFMD